MNITFDIETTGLPLKGSNWDTDFMLFPYLVQLSWKRSDQNGVNDYIITPEGYEIPKQATEIHGISTEKAIKEGTFFHIAAMRFIKDCLEAKYIIGHNIYFDSSIFKANVLRTVQKNIHGLFTKDWIKMTNEALDKNKRIDTMQRTISFCSIPFPSGKGKKWPTLIELHEKLFGESFNAHNSADDVIATERCFNKLVELQVININ